MTTSILPCKTSIPESRKSSAGAYSLVQQGRSIDARIPNLMTGEYVEYFIYICYLRSIHHTVLFIEIRSIKRLKLLAMSVVYLCPMAAQCPLFQPNHVWLAIWSRLPVVRCPLNSRIQPLQYDRFSDDIWHLRLGLYIGEIEQLRISSFSAVSILMSK
jgi:hypothetical protein